MKFGYPFWHQDDWGVLRQVSDAGFDYLEVYLDFPWHRNVPERLEHDLEEHGLGIAFHGPLTDIALCSPIPKVAQCSLDIVEDSIRYVNHLKPLYFNQHILASKIYKNYRKVPPEIYTQAKESFTRLNKLTPNFVVENNVGSVLSEIEEFRGIPCNLCYDIPHSVRTTGNQGIISKWFNHFKERIKAAHVHDVRGQKDHLIIGNGELKFEPIFDYLKKYKVKYALLETFYRKKPQELATMEDWKNGLEYCKRFF
jgi:sugar phosphate isomerase/epimerase